VDHALSLVRDASSSDNGRMKSVRSFLPVVFLVGCTAGAGPTETSTPSAAPSPLEPLASTGEPTSGARVLGQLRTRDQRATLLMAHDGLHVTVHDASGGLVAQDLPIDELRQSDPFLYEVCRSSVASNHYLDARLDEPRSFESAGRGEHPSGMPSTSFK
jgi:hypothetical protein